MKTQIRLLLAACVAIALFTSSVLAEDPTRIEILLDGPRARACNEHGCGDYSPIMGVPTAPEPTPTPPPEPTPPPAPTPPPIPPTSSPKTCAQARLNPGVVFCQDFDGSALGDWNVTDLKADFPGASGFISGPNKGRATIVSGGNAVSGNSLRATFPKTKVGGGDTGVLFLAPVGVANLNEAYFGYWVRFDPGFPMLKGGKIPGLSSGTDDNGRDQPAGGRPMKLGKGFSNRLMFIGGRRFQDYFYWIDNPAPMTGAKRFGGPRHNLGTWVPGQWYFIESHVKLNTPAGAKNGLFEVWINGKRVTYIPNTRIRGPGQNFPITHIQFQTYLGGGDASWYSPKDTYNYFDTVVVSRNRIGRTLP